MEDDSCKTCRWWGVAYEGSCDRFGMLDNDELPDPAGIFVRADDDQGLDARFQTSPEFGCRAHEVDYVDEEAKS